MNRILVYATFLKGGPYFISLVLEAISVRMHDQKLKIENVKEIDNS